MTTHLPITWTTRFRGTLLAGALLLGGLTAQAQVDTYQFAPSQGTYTPLTGGTTVSAIQVDDAVSGPISSTQTTTLPAGGAV